MKESNFTDRCGGAKSQRDETWSVFYSKIREMWQRHEDQIHPHYVYLTAADFSVYKELIDWSMHSYRTHGAWLGGDHVQ
ncbi:MAG: hypothetical protein HQK54_17370 [Oligoflexales bacterium]|nr:hypothetical protein [Oligoflexales bacterium]